MLTGHASVEFGLKGMQLGAFDYIMKPAPLTELLDTIGQAYNKKRRELDPDKHAIRTVYTSPCGHLR